MRTTHSYLQFASRAFDLSIMPGVRPIAVLAGTIALISSISLSLTSGNMPAAFVLLALYAATIAILWLPNVRSMQRLLVMSLIAYLFAVNALLNLGPVGAGRLWLVAFCAVTGAFLGFRAGLLAVAMATVTFALYYFAITLQLIPSRFATDMTQSIWIDQMLDVPFFSLLITLPIIHVINGLYEKFEEERRQKTELRAANEKLGELNADLMAFDYSFSNALKAPLYRLAGYLKLAKEEREGGSPDFEARFLEKAEGMAGDLHGLINDLMTLGRMKKIDLNCIWLDFSKLSSSIAERYQEKEPERRVKVIIKPGISIHADLVMAKRAFRNLFDNAWKFTASAADPVITIGVLERAGRKHLFVADNGEGIKVEERDAVFQPFHAYHTCGEFDTAGLSLPITRRIVERHGGTIHVEENEDDGATFIITFGPDDEWLRMDDTSGEGSILPL